MMMTSNIRRYAAKGFTLIELLIVVIIIAILAAIAIPQFSNSSTDAQESASLANLATIRSAVELYRAQHNGIYPSKAPVGSAPTTTCPLAGAATDNDTTTFTDQLTKYSSASGHTCTTQVAGYIYGPYLRAIPAEPLTNANAVVIATTDTANAPTATTTGWRFQNVTGAVQINSIKLSRDGTTTLASK